MDFLTSLHQYSDWGLLALRLALATVFLVHGLPKLKGAMGSGFMTFIGGAETLGAAALFLGFLTPLAALGLGIIMLGAIWKKTQEWHVPFTAQDKMGWEFDLVILGACVALMTLGAGVVSVDAGVGWM